jgi:hypothetical protein
VMSLATPAIRYGTPSSLSTGDERTLIQRSSPSDNASLEEIVVMAQKRAGAWRECRWWPTPGGRNRIGPRRAAGLPLPVAALQ